MDINIQHQFAPSIINQKASGNVGFVEANSGISGESSGEAKGQQRTRNHRPRELEMVYKKLYQTENKRRTSDRTY
jgi:hypothetical protein